MLVIRTLNSFILRSKSFAKFPLPISNLFVVKMSDTDVNKKHFMSSGEDDKLETDTSILASKKIKKEFEDIVDPNETKKHFMSSGEDDKLETDTSILASKKIKKEFEDIVDPNESKEESSQVEGSTQWRLRIKNVPKFASTKMIKELLAKHSCGDVKIKKSHEWDFCYAFFKTQEQQLQAIDKLKNVNFKNRTLVVNIENITEQDRQSLFNQRHEQRKKNFFNPNGEIQRSPEELLADQITPLHKLSYEDQLKHKEDLIKKSLSKFRNKIKELYKDRPLYKPTWAIEKSDSNLPCILQQTISSPILEGYRNKCEFTIGRNLNGEIRIGFLLGSFKDGINTVIEPDKSLNVSELAKKIVKAMQDYIVKSPYDVYDTKNKKGTWRMLTVRTQISDDADDKPFDCISGTQFIFEKMMDCRFRISPRAFFQTNTLAAQVLYEKCCEYIKDLFISEKDSVTLIDMCCGTGTIGIALSKNLGDKIDKVIGIELCEEAVEDAKFNATLNGINNSEYILGPVEKNLKTLYSYKQAKTGTVVAIVDPPRAGVHKNVIKALRECKAIDYFLYVSCDCNLAAQNFIDLCRPTTNNFPGTPFKPVRAVGVDLFPHAKQVELLIEFHRDNDYPTKNVLKSDS
ncbi:S-adenosyl-L-methionine-dependent methyltransferase [Gigaspora margarita]|uniref:S-adenosyl-L-methionine-dependent methyltransferase n=1 Tax=Gigaspora margarita TaxID=4874 RepID=A0A8H4A7E2_GIGMA|nr:S-adenosyl-L-methionine-dependent methyltransferase [Gigaspora margarita]